MFGNTYIDTDKIQNKNLGLGVTAVFTRPSHNHLTKEWLDVMIEAKKNFIYISEINNYGHIMGYCINLDKEDNDRKHIWRNTKEKINKIKELGLLYEGNFTFGGFGDSYSSKYENCILKENIERLKKLGWETNNILI